MFLGLHLKYLSQKTIRGRQVEISENEVPATNYAMGCGTVLNNQKIDVHQGREKLLSSDCRNVLKLENRIGFGAS